MSLSTDRFFYEALKADRHVMQATRGRVFNTARPWTDEEEDQVPYVVITFDGAENETPTKDDVEGDWDDASVSVLYVAATREELARLVEGGREAAIRRAGQERNSEHPDRLAPLDWQLSAGPVMYDPAKPCFFQALSYRCSTLRKVES